MSLKVGGVTDYDEGSSVTQGDKKEAALASNHTKTRFIPKI